MTDISFFSLMASYGLILAFVYFLYLRKLQLTKTIILSSWQGIIQLTAAGFAVSWLFKINNSWILCGMVFVMCGFASYLTSRRWKSFKKMWCLVTTVIFVTTFLNLAILLLIKVIPWSVQYVIPVSGMLIGQVMNNCSFFIERVTFSTTQSKTLLEANLSLGAVSKKVLEPIVNQAIKTCSMPMVDMLKTLGVVYLPGTMAGLIMGGVDPIVAVKYQLVIIFMLTFAFGFSSIAMALFIHKVLFNKNHQIYLSLPDFDAPERM